MSTQLVVYPQYYAGYNTVSVPQLSQWAVNGFDFSGVGSAVVFSTGSINPWGQSIASSPPAILGDWYVFHTNTTGGNWGTISPPSVVNQTDVIFHYNAAQLGTSAIYQQLSQLIPGTLYQGTITIDTPVNGDITVKTYNGSIPTTSQTGSASATTMVFNFIAASSNDTIFISYASMTHQLKVIEITIYQQATTITQIRNELQDGQVICDLYKDEDIPLTLSVDDFTNVAEKVQSYSKDFDLPGTKRNNRIFDNIFEITRSDDGIVFNPYVQTKCVLKQDGFLLFEGFLRMIKIKEKEGQLSYNVNLYSEVIAVADILKTKTLADLDFSELDHYYNRDNIKNSQYEPSSGQGLELINPLSTDSRAYNALLGINETNVLKYPWINWNNKWHQATYAEAASLGALATHPFLHSLSSAFRPTIQLKYLINRMFDDAGFTWESEFFDTTDFGNLFMDFNWGSENTPQNTDITIGSATQLETRTASPQAAGASPAWNTIQQADNEFTPNVGYASGVYTAQQHNVDYTIDYCIKTRVQGVAGAQIIRSMRWKMVKNGVTSSPVMTIMNQISADSSGTSGIYYDFTGTLTETLNTGDTLEPQVAFNHTGTTPVFTASVQADTDQPTIVSVTAEAITSAALLQTLRGELNQWAFFKGLMQMFNLVTMVDENDENNIIIEPYVDIFSQTSHSGNTTDLSLKTRGVQLDWTDKVDVSQMDFKPLTNLNKTTNFVFAEDEDDYAFGVYKHALNGFLYGSKVWAADGYTILSGTKKISAEPFAATICKTLKPWLSTLIVPTLYARGDDGVTEGFDNSPRILYNNGVKSCQSYYVPNQGVGTTGANRTDYLQFSHLTEIPTVGGTLDYNFGECQYFSPIGVTSTNNLFNMYWLPYFRELYHPDTRIMTLKVNLTPSDIASFNFFDKVFIKNRIFRVNKINYKPNALATVEFILIP